jgi:hypothetical protein
MKQSSTINSNISSPSEVECQSKLCWTKTIIAPRMIRGFSLVKKAISRKDSLPLVASVSATVYILKHEGHSQSSPATWKDTVNSQP